MAIAIHTSATSTPIEVIPLADIDGDSLKPATAFGSEEPKLVDGRPVFSLPSIVVRMGGEVLKTASVKVFTKPGKLTALQPVALTGSLTITPWTTRDSGTVRLSIVADGIASPKGDR
ncbi:hypothetical protein [Bifidobacterium sp. ESL0825]|uniref:hypothetical protein n=1 Tax=Bifidobacterium sp. ESL0825 TaxID=3448587 RepID=UPI0040420C30